MRRGLDIHTQYGIILMVDLRRIIADEMKRQGMTQRSLQTLTGIWQHRISEYLSGKRDMGSDSVAKLLDALRLRVAPTGAKQTKRKGR